MVAERTPCKHEKCKCPEFRPRSKQLMVCYGCGHSIEFHQGARAKEIKNASKK